MDTFKTTPMDTFKTTPMVDLVTQLPGPAYNPPRLFDDPDVARYTHYTGPELGAMPRAVFRELGPLRRPHNRQV